jgi:hypothetical protein
MNGPPTVALRPVAHLPWDQSLPLEVSVTGPEPGAGAFEVPGPTRIPVRPLAELTAGAGGIVARILGPDGLPRPYAVRVEGPGTTVSLPAPPLSLAPRADGGLWSLQRDGLHHVSSEGAVVSSVAVFGVRLLPLGGDGVWVLGLDQAWPVQGGGTAAGPHDWRDPLGSSVWNDSLCRPVPGGSAGIYCLDEAGRLTFSEMPTAPGPFERLVAMGSEFVLTSTADTLRRYGRDGPVAALTVRGAGRTAKGEPFLAAADGDATLLWFANAPPRRLSPSKAGLSAAASVVAVQGERVLLWEGSRAAWFAGGDVERSFPVDDAGYATELFPHAWRADRPYPFVAGRNGSVLIAASGPSGIAVLEIGGMGEP